MAAVIGTQEESEGIFQVTELLLELVPIDVEALMLVQSGVEPE